MPTNSKDNSVLGDSYQLIDSGNFLKLEYFSGKRIIRPSSLCLWHQNLPASEWGKADAVYTPGKGWKFPKKPFTDWILNCPEFKLILKLQSNGQVGIFPEHANYLSSLKNYILDSENKNLSVLNLFAYSGMASVYLMQQGATVCHVDSSKKVLEWAKENAALNKLPEGRLRLIADDALGFMKRENRRNNLYDIVILDPPSFSRLDGKKTWKLEEVIFEFAESAFKLLKKNGLLVFSCHHHALDSRVLKNIFSAYKLDIKGSYDQSISEKSGIRVLPAGSSVTLKKV